MRRTWTIIAVQDVFGTSTGMGSLGLESKHSVEHDYFGQVWTPMAPSCFAFIGGGTTTTLPYPAPRTESRGTDCSCFFAWTTSTRLFHEREVLMLRFEEEPRINPGTKTLEFSLLDPDGYYVSISALAAA